MSLAARERLWVTVRVLRLQSHERKQLPHAPRALGCRDAVRLERLADDVAHGQARIERGHGVLEYDLDIAAHAKTLLGRHRCRVAAEHRYAAGLRR